MNVNAHSSAAVKQAQKVPALFIGGAPKCGTSSLFNWLNDHPAMAGSSPKETFFLMDRHNPMLNRQNNYLHHGIQGYSSFYPDSQQGKILFEATTHYMYQHTALQVLSQLTPAPHVFFLLRKPSQRMLSSFEFTRNNRAGFRKDLSFATYVDILLSGEEQQLDEYISREKSLYVLKQDLYYSTYILFLEKWKKAIGEENLSVFLFEDLVRSPLETLTRMARRLGIDERFYQTYSFPKKNETYSVKHKRAHRLIRSFSAHFPAGNLRAGVKKLYLSLQHQKVRKDQDSQQALLRLDQYFEPYNAALSKLFHLNLAAWQ